MGLFNVFGKAVNSVKQAKDDFGRAAFAKDAFLEAERLAETKYLRAAAKIAEEILNTWTGNISWVQEVALGELIGQVREKLGHWQQEISEADSLANSAKSLIE